MGKHALQVFFTTPINLLLFVFHVSPLLLKSDDFTLQSLKILGSFTTVRGLLAPLGKVELLMLGTQYAEWDVACMAQEEGGIGIIQCLATV